MKKTVGQLFRDKREDLDLTQQQVADILRVDRSTYAYYERDKIEPNLKMTKKICDILNIEYIKVFDCV